MNVYLKAYLKNNLGDDLFIQTICERYPNTTFHIISKQNNSTLSQIKNLHIHRPSIIHKCLNRLLHTNSQENHLRHATDMMVYIGGSIFIQKPNIKPYIFNSKVYKNKKPYCIIGFNIGPYYEEGYLEYINENIFKGASFLGVRDKKSYSLLKYKDNAIYAPDIMFSVSPQAGKKRNKDYAIISVVDMRKKASAEQAEQYEVYIKKLCKELEKAKITPILMSFCEFEGDEAIIDRIQSQDKSIKDYRYRGDIDEAMSLFSNAKLIFGSRFHASILALSHQIPLIPFAYSAKTTNLLNSIGYTGEVLTTDNLNDLKIKTTINDALSKKDTLKLQAIRKESEVHFKYLDTLLK